MPAARDGFCTRGQGRIIERVLVRDRLGRMLQRDETAVCFRGKLKHLDCDGSSGQPDRLAGNWVFERCFLYIRRAERYEWETISNCLGRGGYIGSSARQGVVAEIDLKNIVVGRAGELDDILSCWVGCERGMAARYGLSESWPHS